VTATAAPTDPYTVMGAIDADARSLDHASARLGRVIKELVDTEARYDTAFQSELVRIHHAAKQEGTRPPAEDIRKALAARSVDSTLYGRYLALQAEVEALKQFVRSREAILSARQSLLSALRAEARAG
jgi:hypothetical protein